MPILKAGPLNTLIFLLAIFLLPLPSKADGPPAPPMPPPAPLNSWRFDTSSLTNSHGGYPIEATNLALVSSWDNNAVLVSGTSAMLAYPTIQTNGVTNLLVNNGSLRLWVRPHWTGTNLGGPGPGHSATVINVGAYTTNASIGFWSLYTDSSGSRLYFSAQTNGQGSNYVSAPIEWASNTWHLIWLSYTPSNTVLFVDGLTNYGPGVLYYPSFSVYTNGFTLGCDAYAQNVANCEFEQFRTYPAPVGLDWKSIYYANMIERINSLEGEGGQQNGIQVIGGDDGGESSGDLRLLPPRFEGTNMVLAFEGSDPLEYYDLYFSTNLANWVWLGRSHPAQTNFLMIDWPTNSGFFVLGTQYDGDGDSLPDAYETLLALADPAVANTPASLGANSNLVISVPSDLRVFQYRDQILWNDLWDPCNPTNIMALHSTGRVAWSRALGGTNYYSEYWVDCIGQTPYFWDVYQSTNYDAPDMSPWKKLDWRLNSLSGTNVTRTLERSADTQIELFTGGPPLSVKVWPYIIQGSAQQVVPNFSDSSDYGTAGTNIPPTHISVGGLPLSTNGDLVLNFRDNLTTNLTPLVSGNTNYTFSLIAGKVKVTLNFHNSGQLTARETTNQFGQVIGYDADTYDGATNHLRTSTLGTGNPTNSLGQFFNFEETSSTVPTNLLFNSGWQWHRDVQDKVFFWRPEYGLQNIDVLDGTNFTAGTAGEGTGNDSGSPAEDNIPDASRLILICDGPGVGLPGAPSTLAPPGTILAHRFYAREWVTWNGVRVSDILRWESFLTIQRNNDLSWQRKGPNVIELVTPGGSESPTFTPQQAQEIYQQ